MGRRPRGPGAPGPDGGRSEPRDDGWRDGLVVASHGRHYVIEADDGHRRLAHPRGKRSECVVGDRVRWAPTGDPGAAAAEGVVESLHARRNLLYRQDDWKTKAFAANLDQVLVMVAAQPVFSESQLARALVAAADAGLPARILLNKTDLPEIAAARERLVPYRAMGVDVVELAIKADPEGSARRLREVVDGRTSLVLGPSGVGKSTLINRLVPDAGVQVGEISQALNSGRHTTTTTHWYWIDPPGTEPRTAVIDSPGFQEFGLRHIPPDDLVARMPDLATHAGGCRFYNCTHRHEPGCTVLAAAEAGLIAPSRLRLYRELRDELERPRPY